MTAYNWGTSTFPVAQFDGQLYVDDRMRVYAWSSANNLWTRPATFELHKITTIGLVNSGANVSQLIQIATRRNGAFSNQYNQAWYLAFSEVTGSSTGHIYGRRASIPDSDLGDWILSVTPETAPGSGIVAESLNLSVYEVLDTTLGNMTIHTWNGLFASMRGRDAYRSSRARNQAGLNPFCGVSEKFKTWVGTDNLAAQLVNFCGLGSPGTEETNALWFPANRKSYYAQPRQGDNLTGSTQGNRMCWNSATNHWEIPSSDLVVTDTPPSSPVLIAVTESGNLELNNPARLRNLELLAERQDVVIAHHLQAGNQHAFYVKPFGVTRLAVETELSTSDWMLICEHHYQGDAIAKKLQIVNNLFDKRDRALGWRTTIYDAFGNLTQSVIKCHSATTDMLPREMCFYVLNSATGLRSPLFNSKIAVRRRRSNAPYLFVDSRR